MFKVESLAKIRVLSGIIALLALFLSMVGIINPGVYKPIVLDRDMPWMLSQDIISSIASIVLLYFIIWGKKGDVKQSIFQIGLVSYFFYAYGQYVLGTLYNFLYYFYICEFGLSIFFFIIVFTSIRYKSIDLKLPNVARWIIALYCLATPAIFAPQWIITIWQNVLAHTRPESDSNFSFNVAVHILDLSFVLPVCAIAGVLLLRKNVLGLLLGGILQIKGFTLLFFVALGYYFQPTLFHQNLDFANMVLYTIVSFIFLIFSFIYFKFSKDCSLKTIN